MIKSDNQQFFQVEVFNGGTYQKVRIQYPHDYINISFQMCKDFEHDKKAGKTGIPALYKEY